MSKTKKIATAVVSIVLASSMCIGLTACGDGDRIDYPTFTPTTPTGSSQNMLTLSISEDSVDEEGNVKNDVKLAYNTGTSLSMNVGYQNSGRYGYITYQNADGLVSGEFDLFGTRYAAGRLKPAWQALSTELGINFADNFQNLSSDAQVEQAMTDGNLATYNVITASANIITTNANSDPDLFLDLSLYLDYMPNYKAFLEENPLVMLSLTSNVDTGAMYYAPYFDGNDDIEKYEIANMNWIEALLDGAAAGDKTTFTEQAKAKQSDAEGSTSVSRQGDVSDGTQAKAASYMGTEGNWWVEVTDVDNSDLNADGTLKDGVDTSQTTKVYVDYDNVLAKLDDTNSDLYKAVAAAGVTDPTSLESGNIVDIQNAAINAKKGEVTGAQLLAILRNYIDVAYLDADGGDSFYATRSDVFNGYNAAWDVDLLVALSRCVVTNNSLLGTDTAMKDVYALSGRQGTTQRMNDLLSLTGELYGERGLTFRYEYAYVDDKDTVQDARLNESTYEALDKMNALVEEGLIYSGTATGNGTISYYTKDEIEALMIYDYVQTQTANGGYTAMGVSEKAKGAVDENYNFAPILTPVSKWSDGTTEATDGEDYDFTADGEKIMRFTESWRSVKNTGFCVPYDSVKDRPEALSAVLTFIDYLFSNDGQILMTYGPMSETNDCKETSDGVYTSEDNGFWHDEEADVQLSTVAEQVAGSSQYTVKDEYAAQYFVYKNKVYTGTYYKGEMQPTMTDANLNLYYGYTVNELKLGSAPIGSNYALNYTSYARGVIGSALPIGNKLQSFEYQCTADCGIIGADKVAACLTNGTISHVYLQVDNPKGNPWYTIIPTTLPYDQATSAAINTNYSPHNTTWFRSSSSAPMINFLLEVMFRGLDGENSENTYLGTDGGTLPNSAAKAVEMVEELGWDTYLGYMRAAWTALIEYYEG